MQTSLDLSSLSRRDALKAGLIFSSGLLAGNWTSRAAAAEPKMDFGKDGLHFLAVGDYGSGGESQRLVAQRMNEFAGSLGTPLTAVLALGDNFYNKLETERFGRGFEEMYSKQHLDCPFYATLGNHDYGPGYDSKQGAPKADIQLAYAKDNPTSRWKMPAKWYTVEFPNAANPLVKIIYLDSNMHEEGMLTPQEKLDQKRFLEAELAKERKANWLWIVAHHPVFTDTIKRKDSPGLIKNWGGYLQQNPVSLYLSGHDHNLQHLRQPDYSASFLVSGGGGAKSYETKLSDRGFSKPVYGFNHIHVNEERIKVQIIDADGKCLHAFTRDMSGKMEITV